MFSCNEGGPIVQIRWKVYNNMNHSDRCCVGWRWTERSQNLVHWLVLQLAKLISALLPKLCVCDRHNVRHSVYSSVARNTLRGEGDNFLTFRKKLTASVFTAYSSVKNSGYIKWKPTDATMVKIYIYIYIYIYWNISTCFGHHYAHHQDTNIVRLL
jgi:hypothetical protein